MKATTAGAILMLLTSPALPAAPTKEAAPAEPNAIIHVHDPDAAKEGAWTYVFSTGPGVMIRRSRDRVNWTFLGSVFPDGTPGWAREAVPGADPKHIWAPGIARFNGLWHVYYSVSTFGKNRSVIGLATNKTLDPNSKDYRWEDRGKAWESNLGDDYNAIDAEVLLAGKDRGYLVFGSWWTGIRMVPLDLKTGKPAPDAKIFPVARRPFPGAMEAPFPAKLGRYYYLFTSWDLCCRGVNSTYNIRVGRSEKPEGPYVDRDGKPLLDGGGTLVLASQGRWFGPGHCSVLQDGRKTFLVYHAYDGRNNGIPTLRLRPMTMDKEGWPVLGEDLFEPPAPAVKESDAHP